MSGWMKHTSYYMNHFTAVNNIKYLAFAQVRFEHTKHLYRMMHTLVLPPPQSIPKTQRGQLGLPIRIIVRDSFLRELAPQDPALEVKGEGLELRERFDAGLEHPAANAAVGVLHQVALEVAVPSRHRELRQCPCQAFEGSREVVVRHYGVHCDDPERDVLETIDYCAWWRDRGYLLEVSDHEAEGGALEQY